jgi:hypothetical protein
MGEVDNLSDTELLYRLRMEYLQALHLEDFSHIHKVIAPQFWQRFSKYYEEYKKTWKNTRVPSSPVLLMLDPSQEKRMESQWMDHVLRGEIEIWL